MTTITATIPVTIHAQATTYCGATEADNRTWWHASISMFGREIAHAGVNGEGQHTTKRAAVNAAIRKARDHGYKLTVSRAKVAAAA